MNLEAFSRSLLEDVFSSRRWSLGNFSLVQLVQGFEFRINLQTSKILLWAHDVIKTYSNIQKYTSYKRKQKQTSNNFEQSTTLRIYMVLNFTNINLYSRHWVIGLLVTGNIQFQTFSSPLTEWLWPLGYLTVCCSSHH